MNAGYTWIVNFNTDLGDVSSLTADIMSMTGSAPVLAVSENVKGVAPSFASLDPYNSLPLGSATLTDLSDLSMSVAGLEEGVSYYFRVTASNYIGSGTALLCSACCRLRFRLASYHRFAAVSSHTGVVSTLTILAPPAFVVVNFSYWMLLPF